jgi:NADPH-dependent ferric siderophore reductase
MTDRPARRPIRTHHTEVRRSDWLTPHMIRVTVGGPGVEAFADNGCTDRYVKLVFPRPGVEYPEPFDVGAIRAELPREKWPITRTYTVRSYEASPGELAIDFVYHGDEGFAGPWAAGAKPGDELLFLGPGGAYAPDPAADWHLLVGDESTLPAIASALEQLPAGSRARVFVEVGNSADEQPLDSPGQAEVTWLHRSAGADLVAAVRGLTFPGGDVHAFVHGEAGFVHELRDHLLKERGVPRERLSISGYWRRGKDEDAWQTEKAATRTST